MSSSEETSAKLWPVKRAILSVFDKTGLVELSRGLVAAGVEILASGGTARALREAGIAVTAVEDYTGAPEILDGRVKTLHPKIHAGLLADRSSAAHLADLSRCGYGGIELVVCNLYPFARAVAEGRSREEIIEMIDIGGPSLLRGAAKNHDGGSAVVVDPADYERLLEAVRQGGLPQKLRRELAAKVFALTADYDAAIAEWFARDIDKTADSAVFAPRIGSFRRHTPLRYGENPHQRAYLYIDSNEKTGAAHGEKLGGKELSYNNYLDLDAAYRAVYGLPENACAVIKHTNPCGLAVAATQPAAFTEAVAGDPVSAFGSVLGFNQPLTQAGAEAILASRLFVECIIAPGFEPAASELFKSRANLRLVTAPPGDPAPAMHFHRIGGGLLVEEVDRGIGDPHSFTVVTRRGLEPGWLEELAFAMRAALLLKSNAIAVTKGRALLGAGAGHMSRVDAAAQALHKAGTRAHGAFLSSDAYFPFPDCVKLAAAAGIVAIIQPGGSVRDSESIAEADQHGLAMVFTGRRHFRH